MTIPAPLTAPATEPRRRRRRRLIVGTAAVVAIALVAVGVVWARGGFSAAVPTSGAPGFTMRGDLAADQGLLDAARREWARASDKDRRPAGEVTALWAGTVSTRVLDGGGYVPPAAADEADVVVLIDDDHLATVARFRDGSGGGSGKTALYHWAARPTFLSTTLDVGAGLVLLADYRTVEPDGLTSTKDGNDWHQVDVALQDGLLQRDAQDDDLVTVRVVDEGVLLIDEFASTFYRLTDAVPAGGGEDPSWAALSDPARASDARAAVLEAGEAAVAAWRDAPVDQTATWIADVELDGGLPGTVFAVGSADVDTFAVLALGTGGDSAVPGTVLGKHLSGYGSPGTAARIPPLGAAWVSTGDGDAQLVVVGTESVTSLDIQIGTERTTVAGRIAVLAQPAERAWVSTGDPQDSELPQYAVVGQTADGWPVPLDGH
ncbi:hypothetical protein [Pengzhenrongella sicca]|uniref:Uncharacterized protein n=1 Tax=Pengzhenrongella sicca TaxID=2819238 RepID=A0A8A4ZHV7_9MICO|nr:hypothetical protein [Pengzhenrongella sicca]QTE30971.1 hypothetical protein J4E96_08620 [Pengzhenrongella sicca]